MCQHRCGVAHHHWPVDRRDHAFESRALRTFDGDLLGIERLEWRAVIEIRQGDDVAVRREALRHLAKLRPDAERVHVHHDSRPRPALSCAGGAVILRLEDVRVERPVLGLQINPVLIHDRAF